MTIQTEERTDRRTRFAPRHQLVLLDDDEHTYEYVIEMLGAVFGYGTQKAFLLAKEVDTTGRAVLFIGPLEIVELKQQKVLAYGADPRIQRCRGSMTAVVEPVSD